MSHMAMSAGGLCLDPKWYLVKTKALNETRVHTRLTGAGYEVLFPKIQQEIETPPRPLRDSPPLPDLPLRPVRRRRAEHHQIHPRRRPRHLLRPGAPRSGRGDHRRRPRADERGGDRQAGAEEGHPVPRPARQDRRRAPSRASTRSSSRRLPDRERVVLLLDAVSSYRLTVQKDSLEP